MSALYIGVLLEGEVELSEFVIADWVVSAMPTATLFTAQLLSVAKYSRPKRTSASYVEVMVLIAFTAPFHLVPLMLPERSSTISKSGFSQAAHACGTGRRIVQAQARAKTAPRLARLMTSSAPGYTAMLGKKGQQSAAFGRPAGSGRSAESPHKV